MEKSSVLKFVRVIMAGYIILLPWYIVLFHTHHDSFIVKILGSTLVSGGFVLLFLALFLFLVITPTDRAIRLNQVDIIAILASTLVAGHWVHSGISTVDPFLFIKILSVILCYTLLRLSQLPHRWILLSCFISILLQSIYGLSQYFQPTISINFLPENSITGSFFNSGPFGGFMALGVILCAGLVMHAQAIRMKWLYAITGVPVFAALVLSESRAGWIAAISGILYLLWERHKIRISSAFGKKPIRGGLILMMILITGIFVTIELYEYKKDSADGRWLIWGNTIGMIRDHPWLGAGPGQFSARYMHVQAANFEPFEDSRQSILAGDTTFAFNEILHIGAEFGFIGVFLLLGLMYLLFFYPSKLESRQELSPIRMERAAILGFSVFGLFSYPFSILLISMVFVLLTSQISNEIRGLSFHPPDRFRKVQWFRIIRYLFAFIMGVVVVIYSCFYLIQVDGCRKWNSALVAFDADKPEVELEQLNDVYPILKNNGLFIASYGRLLVLSGRYREAILVLKLAGQLAPSTQVYLDLGNAFKNLAKSDQAEKYYLYAHRMIPGRIKPYYKLADLYREMEQMENMKKIIRRYLDRKHTKQTLASYELELEIKEWLLDQ